jgi:hypothetical protein
MIKNNFMKYLNIAFSGAVFLCLGIVIIIKTFSSDEFLMGAIEKASCVEDTYRKGTFTYTLSIQNKGTFGNRLNIPCDKISVLKIGDQVKVETSGHLLMQLSSKGTILIDRQMVERREAKINFMIYIIFLIAMGDFLYRIYTLYKEREHKKS